MLLGSPRRWGAIRSRYRRLVRQMRAKNVYKKKNFEGKGMEAKEEVQEKNDDGLETCYTGEGALSFRVTR